MTLFHRSSKYLMPVLISLALVFSQVFGFKHGYDHQQHRVDSKNFEHSSFGVDADAVLSISDSKQSQHSCVAFDAASLAVFGIALAYLIKLLTQLKQAQVGSFENTYSRKNKSFYLSRAPPSIY